ncbi:MAG: hypothetical protein AB7O39_03340 [Flavobacteriaceae bacterium]
MARPDIRLVTDDYAKQSSASLKTGGGGGTYDGMEARVKLLEYRAEQADKMFARIDAKLDGIAKDMSEIKGRISAMPTTWQLITMVLAIMGATFAFIRFGLTGI